MADPNVDAGLKKIVTLALLGVKHSGKTSLANCFLGHNVYKDEAHNNKLDLFQVTDDNNDGHKNGYVLG